ncbi:MAG: type I DNA topoisomerase [Lachnospiraceae bacterium]|nr:type I DNA topoisomerase [Lachnospiraceae bacterium]MEE3379414.1 type I DNA topoisomerase [Lachnospiraceae bacterium]MEE3432330.1 type I DNA topoisomerase [Lachnospiraceae bacterium]
MAKNLVIVESPTKVKTIKKFLGKNYEVVASQGHVRDLPKSSLGIDVDNDFEPRYITIRGKGNLLSSLRKEVKKADHIYLATDPDREGEAISWHLLEALNLKGKDVKRITFNEITKNAVKASFKKPRDIDLSLVDAQQARRILDRLVGYEISPLIWAKVKRGLSAGRVQSVALRIVAEREAEIDAFIPQEYYTLDVNLKGKGAKDKLTCGFYGRKSGKEEINDKASLDKIMSELTGEQFKVLSVKKTYREKKAPLPFTTSTLQQEAFKALNFSTSKTMRVAQQLYEGVDIKGAGTVGLITYLRTDSVRVSDEAKNMAHDFISENYGDDFLREGPGKTSAASRIQDAHEAIRPADLTRLPSNVKDSLTREQFRLYQLIWRRFMASRMSNAKYETTTAKIQAGEYIFSTAASHRIFDGFMLVYTDAEEEKEEKKSPVYSLEEGQVLEFDSFDEKQHFTQPPAHFTEASLVHTMEELGIGRPSTYAPTIGTLLARNYVTKEGRNLFMTELGDAVNNIMTEWFPTIVDKTFTANMESLLDGVEEGKVEWKSIIRNFYPDLEESVKKAQELLEKVQIADEETDVVCDKCGRHMVIKYGKFGKFLACPGFPECSNTKPYLEKIGVPCPKCGKDIVIRKTRKGRVFYGCENYPDCDFTSWQKPVEKACPKCGKFMVIRGNRIVCSDQECGYSEAQKKDNA